jgi:hypothetical protein
MEEMLQKEGGKYIAGAYPLAVNRLRVNDSQRINSVWDFFSQDLPHSLLRSVSGSAFFRE